MDVHPHPPNVDNYEYKDSLLVSYRYPYHMPCNGVHMIRTDSGYLFRFRGIAAPDQHPIITWCSGQHVSTSPIQSESPVIYHSNIPIPSDWRWRWRWRTVISAHKDSRSGYRIGTIAIPLNVMFYSNQSENSGWFHVVEIEKFKNYHWLRLKCNEGQELRAHSFRNRDSTRDHA